MPSRALLLLNPRAGLELVVEPTGDPSSLTGGIRRHAAEVDRVAGGDGMINQAVQVLVGLGLSLAIIPVGHLRDAARGGGSRALEVFMSEPASSEPASA
jgi:diacylglycerol kinase family enzyme